MLRSGAVQPRPLLVSLALAALALRVWGLPLWGTFDMEVLKAWSARAATAGLADIYGPNDAEVVARGLAVPRTTFTWGSATYFVDYPPGAIVFLWAAGEVYAAFRPAMPNRPAFNAALNVAPLVGSIAVAALLARSARAGLFASPTSSWTRALAFWLSPAAILSAPVLGYTDTLFAAFALPAVLLMAERRFGWAAFLLVVAGLVKPQGALLVPAFVVLLLRRGGRRGAALALGGALSAAVLVLAPWWTSGHLLSALDGCRRPLTQTTLAPLGLNVWWIAAWARALDLEGAWPLVRSIGIAEFADWARFEPRAVSRVLLLAATAVPAALLWRRPGDPRVLVLALVAQIQGYALVGTSVHENHTFFVVALAPLLLGLWPRAWALLVSTSAFVFASLFFAAGFGRRITSLRVLDEIRRLTVVDATVIVAALNVVLTAFVFAWLVRAARAEPAPA